MSKRIYLSIIYFITLICIIIGVLGNVFNISPFTRITMHPVANILKILPLMIMCQTYLLI